MLYDITAPTPDVDARGHFHVPVTISLTQSVAPVRTEIHLLPSRDITIATPCVQHATLDNTPHKLDITGRIDRLDQPRPQITVRPFSTDPAKIGFGHRVIALPGPHREEQLRVDEPSPRRVKTGETVEIRATPQLDVEGEEPEYIWISPHGVYLESSSSPNPRFIAPAVSELTDIWFTLYIRHHGEVSRPFEFDFQVSPR